MADKTIKVKVDVETDVEPSIAGLKALKKQIKDTAAGTAEFAALQQQIDDVQDSLKAARTGAGNFADVLGGLPGPIGAIGGQASGLITTLKQFGQMKTGDIQASFVELGKDITDVGRGIANVTGLTRVYTVTNAALSKSLIAVGVGEQAAAIGAKALSAALIATGIGALVIGLGLAVNALTELVSGEKAAARATEQLNSAIESQNRLLDLNQKSVANRNRVALAQLKAQGKSEAEIRDAQLKYAREAYETAFKDEQDAAKLYNTKIQKADAEGLKKLQENLDKRQQATKDALASYKELGYNNKASELKEEESKNKELAGKAKQASDARINERKKELEELKKGLEEARLSTLGEKEKELEIVRIKYDELKSKAVTYGQDTKIIEEARAKENLGIAEKYAKEDKDKADKLLQDKLNSETLALDLRLAKGELSESEYQEKIYSIRKQYAVSNDELVKADIDLEKYRTEEKKKSAEEQRQIDLTKLQSKFEALDAENQKVQMDFEADAERYALQKEILTEQEATELENAELTEFQKTEIRKKYADERKAITDAELLNEKAAQQAKVDLQLAYLDLFSQFGSTLQALAGKSKALQIAGIVIEQAAAIGKIVVNTGVANAKALAASPLTGGQPWVAINTISAGLSIATSIAGAAKAISQINAVQTNGSGNSQAVSGGAPTMPKPPTVGSAAAPQVQTTGGANPTAQIGETLAAASGKAVRAYVVSQDIQSQTALDRRTNRAATLGGN